MAFTKTDFSEILRITAHRRMGNETYFEEDKNDPSTKPGVEQNRTYQDTQLHRRELDQCSPLNGVEDVLEEALFKYDDHQSGDKAILKLFSEYGD